MAQDPPKNKEEPPVGYIDTGKVRREIRDDVIILHPIYRKMTTVELDVALTKIEQRIVEERANINKWRHDYLPQLTGQCEEWENLAEDARKDLLASAVNAALSLIMEDQSIKAREKELLLKDEVDEIEKKILTPVVQDEEVVSKHADLLDKLRAARSRGEALKAADGLRETAIRIYNHSNMPEMRERLLNLSLGIIYIATEHDPRARLLISTGEFFSALVWSAKVINTGNEQVEQLLSVAGRELDAVGTLTASYKKHIDDRRSLKRLRQNTT